MGIREILCSFRLVLEGKTGKYIPESSRLEFLGKLFTKNFVLSDAKLCSVSNLLCSLSLSKFYIHNYDANLCSPEV